MIYKQRDKGGLAYFPLSYSLSFTWRRNYSSIWRKDGILSVPLSNSHVLAVIAASVWEMKV